LKWSSEKSPVCAVNHVHFYIRPHTHVHKMNTAMHELMHTTFQCRRAKQSELLCSNAEQRLRESESRAGDAGRQAKGDALRAADAEARLKGAQVKFLKLTPRCLYQVVDANRGFHLLNRMLRPGLKSEGEPGHRAASSANADFAELLKSFRCVKCSCVQSKYEGATFML